MEQVWPKQVRCSVGCRLHGYHGRFSAGRCCYGRGLELLCGGRGARSVCGRRVREEPREGEAVEREKEKPRKKKNRKKKKMGLSKRERGSPLMLLLYPPAPSYGHGPGRRCKCCPRMHGASAAGSAVSEQVWPSSSWWSTVAAEMLCWLQVARLSWAVFSVRGRRGGQLDISSSSWRSLLQVLLMACRRS